MKSMGRRGQIVILPEPVLTSARRWRALGIWRTTLINQMAIAAYCLGISPTRIARWYHRPGRHLSPRGEFGHRQAGNKSRGER